MSEKKLECFKCHQEIIFDNNIKTDSGKMIPLDPENHEKHDCPEYKKGGKTESLPKQDKLDPGDWYVTRIDEIHEIESKVKRRLKQLDNNEPVNEKVGMYVKLLWDRKNR